MVKQSSRTHNHGNRILHPVTPPSILHGFKLCWVGHWSNEFVRSVVHATLNLEYLLQVIYTFLKHVLPAQSLNSTLISSVAVTRAPKSLNWIWLLKVTPTRSSRITSTPVRKLLLFIFGILNAKLLTYICTRFDKKGFWISTVLTIIVFKQYKEILNERLSQKIRCELKNCSKESILNKKN